MKQIKRLICFVLILVFLCPLIASCGTEIEPLTSESVATQTESATEETTPVS